MQRGVWSWGGAGAERGVAMGRGRCREGCGHGEGQVQRGVWPWEGHVQRGVATELCKSHVCYLSVHPIKR